MSQGQQFSEDDFPMIVSPSHVRHCIDLLRQTLMCYSDRTIEEKDDTGGVKGFGTEHQCNDYEELVRLINRWQISS